MRMREDMDGVSTRVLFFPSSLRHFLPAIYECLFSTCDLCERCFLPAKEER